VASGFYFYGCQSLGLPFPYYMELLVDILILTIGSKGRRRYRAAAPEPGVMCLRRKRKVILINEEKNMIKYFSFLLLISVGMPAHSIEYTFCLKTKHEKKEQKVKISIIDIDYRYAFIQYDDYYEASLLLWEEGSTIFNEKHKDFTKDITTDTWVENIGGYPVSDGKFFLTLKDKGGKNIVIKLIYRKNKTKEQIVYYDDKTSYTKYGCKWSRNDRLNLGSY